jgi:hypothetical protein
MGKAESASEVCEISGLHGSVKGLTQAVRLDPTDLWLMNTRVFCSLPYWQEAQTTGRLS